MAEKDIWLPKDETEMKQSTYDELKACFINVKHKPICEEIAKEIGTLKGDSRE